MRKKRTRTPVMLALASLLASLVTFVSSGTASAAEVPMQLVGSPISTEGVGNYVTAPNGNITVGCRSWSGQDLTTYDQTGAVVQQIDRTQQIDNKPNCVFRPAVDKNGDVYGRQYQNGKVLAYDGNTVKWQYPIQCSTADTSVAVGGDGNIYALTTESDGTHLIGLTPEVEPGQSQPAKVLDVKVDEGCATGVIAYKDGIILAKFSSNDSERTYSYFSYGGKYLGQPTFPSDIGFYAKTNAEGRLFRQTNDYANMKVLAYNPGASSPAWMYQFPQSSVTVQTLYPLAGGGVAVQTVDQSGISKLAVLSAAGQFEREIPLDSEYTRVTVDESNRVVTVNIDSSVTPYRTVLRTYDISTGNAIGDTHVLGGTSAGMPDAADAVWTTDDTVYFHAACYWSVPNCDNEVKLYAARVDGTGLDYPRAEVLTAETPTQPASAPYVAMGDSYTAAEGVEPFEGGTENGCHRSTQAYPRVVSADPNIPLSLTGEGFIACSGAVSDDIKDGANAQMNKVTTDTDIITMTIGGNDMPFADFALACVLPGATSCDEGADDVAIAGIASNVIPEVQAMLESLEAHMGTVGSDATVLVLGYPQIVPEAWASVTNGCWWLQPQETPVIREVVAQLNTAIKNEVDAMGGNFHFVSATGSGSPFAGHELCRDASDDEQVPRFFFNVNANAPDAYTFHPNAAGQQAYATLVKNWLAQHPLS